MININVLNKTIADLCGQVTGGRDVVANWERLSEEEFFFEIAVCIIGSQMVYEHSLAIANRLKETGLLKEAASYSAAEFHQKVGSVLAEPVSVETNNGCRKIYPRFKNRLALLISNTVNNIYGADLSVHGILASANSPQNARKLLVEHVSGFGPKQASLFLRRVGYCAEMAVLDTHVLDYMKIAYGLEVKPATLSHLSKYEKLETKLKELAQDFGYSIGCVDLAMWVTMRVAKREFAL